MNFFKKFITNYLPTGDLSLRRGFRRGRSGFTLIEIMIVVVIICLASLIMISLIGQIRKPRDARRKTDLAKIKTALEDLYDDRNSYPASLPACGGSLERAGGSVYLKKIPCDPLTGDDYVYQPDSGSPPQWFKLYTVLENESDEDIDRVGCRISGCGPLGAYNYGVSSSNVSVAP